jgi:hypothetical protein
MFSLAWAKTLMEETMSTTPRMSFNSHGATSPTARPPAIAPIMEPPPMGIAMVAMPRPSGSIPRRT